MAESTITEKFCPRCEVVKSAAAFHSNKWTRTGLQTYCRPCTVVLRQGKQPVLDPTVVRKTCAGCGEEKEAACFGKYRWSPDGLKPQCRACLRLAGLTYRASESSKAKSREYRAATKGSPARKASCRKYRLSEKGRLKQLRARLANKFGLTLEEYQRRSNEQHGRCAICQEPPKGRRKLLHVDHDHKTGIIRELLCNPCNAGLGMLRERIEILERAKAYLKKHNQAGEVKSSEKLTTHSAMTLPLLPPL